MDHVITVRNLVWIAVAGAAICAAASGALWLLGQFNSDV